MGETLTKIPFENKNPHAKSFNRLVSCTLVSTFKFNKPATEMLAWLMFELGIRFCSSF